MTKSNAPRARDLAGNLRSYALLWGVPIAVIVAGMFVDVAVRTALWTAALGWMGVACLRNARLCGRTHCFYTGPFYLAMILPVLALGGGLVSFGPYSWLLLALVAIFGGKAIWWATERAWGRFS